MAWHGRTTGQGSTRQWRKTRLLVLDRDRYVCQLHYDGCTQHATEVDHRTNIAALGIPRRDATDPDDLQAVCHGCHEIKTRAEARRRPPRPPERHPGLV